MKNINIRMSDEMHAALKTEAATAGRDINDIITEALTDHLGDAKLAGSFERRYEWNGYTVRPGLKGWIVERWSRIQGQTTGQKYIVAYTPNCPEGADLNVVKKDSNYPEYEQPMLGDWIARGGAPVTRVLRKGSVVQ